MLHPASMYRLFSPFWWGHLDERWVHQRASYARLTPDVARRHAAPDGPYTAVKFYFNECFPPTPENRAFARGIVRDLARQGAVVSLTTGLRLDDHDGDDIRDPGVHLLPEGLEPRENLAVQTALVAGARRLRRHLRRVLVPGAVSRRAHHRLLLERRRLFPTAPADGPVGPRHDGRGRPAERPTGNDQRPTTNHEPRTTNETSMSIRHDPRHRRSRLHRLAPGGRTGGPRVPGDGARHPGAPGPSLGALAQLREPQGPLRSGRRARPGRVRAAGPGRRRRRALRRGRGRRARACTRWTATWT